MTQRINLQYSIKIEELESEVLRLLTKTHGNMHAVATTLSAFHESGVPCLTVENIQRIDDLRVSLADMDHTLLDVQNIVRGYVQYASEPPTPDQELYKEPHQEEGLGELQTKLRQFRDTLQDSHNENSDQAQEIGNEGAPDSA